VTIVGVFRLLRAEGDAYSEAIERCNENDAEKFVVLAVIIKLMDGKTFSIMHEVIEENGETRLDKALYGRSTVLPDSHKTMWELKNYLYL